MEVSTEAPKSPTQYDAARQRIDAIITRPEFRPGNPQYMAAADEIKNNQIRMEVNSHHGKLLDLEDKEETPSDDVVSLYTSALVEQRGIDLLIHERSTGMPGYRDARNEFRRELNELRTAHEGSGLPGEVADSKWDKDFRDIADRILPPDEQPLSVAQRY